MVKLGPMQPEAKPQLWNRWLFRYWQDRQQGGGRFTGGRGNPSDAGLASASQWIIPIVERHYQTGAIRRIAEASEHNHDRKTVLVMATGAGKIRTVITLCDLLMRCNWATRACSSPPPWRWSDSQPKRIFGQYS